MAIVADPRDSVPTGFPDPGAWKVALKTAFRDAGELCRHLGLSAALQTEAQSGASVFPIFAPRCYVARMRYGDPTDPLLRQVLPLAAEGRDEPGFSADPVGDSHAMLEPGLLQKYDRRVLLITTGACAIHCRYCFRREYPYAQASHADSQWESALQRIAADPSIEEVLLSGGDPLTLRDDVLADLVTRLERIEHVRRLRIHSRLPVVIPSRVNHELFDWLSTTRLTTFMVIHANHAAELDAEVESAIRRLVDGGVPVLNQTVLLRGVNDSIEPLRELFSRLADNRVVPYYLHQLDRVRGASHFEVPIATGRRLIAQLRGCLPGYAVPRYVQEVAGEASKRVLA